MLGKSLPVFALVGLASFTLAFLVLTDPFTQTPAPQPPARIVQAPPPPGADLPVAQEKMERLPGPATEEPAATQLPEHPRTPIRQKKIDYARSQPPLILPKGTVREMLATLDAETSPESDYMAARLIHDCLIRRQSPPSDPALGRDSFRDECEELGPLSPSSWVGRMKAAADAGMARAQVGMVFAENPNPPLAPGDPDPWFDMQRDYVDRAAAQCYPGAYFIRGNFHFKPDDPRAPSQPAYMDFYTLELILRHRFDGVPAQRLEALAALVQEEREKLYHYQIVEAENQALINYHEACTR